MGLNSLPVDDTLEAFDNAMQDLQSNFESFARLAEKTDREDILAYIHGKCREYVRLLNGGIETAREDDNVDLSRYAKLIWARNYHLDLMHYCINKHESFQ